MLRVYEHAGMLHLRDNRGDVSVVLDPEHVTEARRMLDRLDQEGRLRHITLRTILEE